MIRWHTWELNRLITLCLAATILTWLPATKPLLAAEHTIEIRDFEFVPDQLKVAPGDTITWINRDIAPHTATSDDMTWDTQELKQGGAASVIASAEMTLKYFCRFHPNMQAELTLKPE